MGDSCSPFVTIPADQKAYPAHHGFTREAHQSDKDVREDVISATLPLLNMHSHLLSNSLVRFDYCVFLFDDFNIRSSFF